MQMFTDNPTIPAQLEVLLDVVYSMRQRKASAESLRQLIQPDELPGLTPNSRQFANHLLAALELELVKEDDNKDIRLAYKVRGVHEAKPAILDAFARIALADGRVEKWAGRFYAYLIVQDDDTIADTEKGEALANRFMSDLPSSVDQGNPMNKDKYRALERWYRYVGLGWTDPSGAFVPDPTERLRRVLPLIWEKDRRLGGDEFLDRLGRVCPELDGGTLFREVTSRTYLASHRQCTQALASSLRRLHEEDILRLHCPADSKGWSLEKAGLSPVQGEASNRFDEVSMVTHGRRT
jgi:hypothetical protein